MKNREQSFVRRKQIIYLKLKIIVENEAKKYLENKMFAYQNIIEKGKSRKIRFPFYTKKMI